MGWKEIRKEPVYVVERWSDTVRNHLCAPQPVSVSTAARTAGCCVVRDLVFQNAEQLFLKFQAKQSTVFS